MSQVEDHENHHVDHEEQNDDKSSEGDPRVDFAALAVSYGTIDVRHDPNQHSDESSSNSSTHRRSMRRK